MKPKRSAASPSGHRAAALSFLAFGLVALAIVVLLEFLDFRAGRPSFIFGRVLRLQPQEAAEKRFDRGLEALLAEQKLSRDVFRDRAGVVHFKIDVAEPLYAPLARDLRRLVERNGGLHLLSEVQGMKDRVVYLYQVRFGKRLTHVILIDKRLPQAPPGEKPAQSLAAPAKPKPAQKTQAAWTGTPRLAILIDDIGYASLVSDQLRELGIPVTGAVIPSAPYAVSEAKRLHDFGLEEIIHLPMQPRDPANHHPRSEFVLIDSSDAEIEALLRQARAAVPYARGVNNHMGSLLTSDQPAMRRVLGLLKEHGLFFVDSKTATDTVAHAVARALKVPTALRDLFLDDVQTYEHASAQLRALVALARQNGKALAIGHPFPTTLAALHDAVPWLKQQKVDIVFVSQILE
jgi:polysaccharide deacetylase 2 family uncharacterized protein YibQ